MCSRSKRAKNLSKEAKKLIDKYKYYVIKTIEKKLKQGHRYKGYIRIDYPEYFPVFMHTSSGYGFIYEGNKKNDGSQNEWQKKFKDELEENFPGYPIVNVRSDAESGFKNNLKIHGSKTRFQKQKDDTHILMAKINNFASSLSGTVYRANDHYSENNPPMKADLVYDFADKWNQQKEGNGFYERRNDARSKFRTCIYSRLSLWKY